MRFSISATIRHLRFVDRNSLLVAAFNLVAGIVITTLLVVAARDTAYPPAVGFALALLVGGGLTCATVWASLTFGVGEPPEEPAAGNGSRFTPPRSGTRG